MGVTKLWDLLAPCGRRCSVDALARKTLAIDASIWLIQFIKAMRDDSGEMIQNAPLLGLFRRLCKLLFLHVHPVLVFDGATPVLKQRTVARRAAFRERQESSARRTAEKLFLNQLKGKHLLHGVPGATLPTPSAVAGVAASEEAAAAAAEAEAAEVAAAAAALRDQFGEEESEARGPAASEGGDGSGEDEWEEHDEAGAGGWQVDSPGGASGAGTSLREYVARAAAKSGQEEGGSRDYDLGVSGAARLAHGTMVVPRADQLDEGVVRHLPASMQFELLDEIKVSERNRLRDQLVRREARGDLTTESFSHTQLSNYIEVSKVAGKVRARHDGCGSAMYLPSPHPPCMSRGPVSG